MMKLLLTIPDELAKGFVRHLEYLHLDDDDGLSDATIMQEEGLSVAQYTQIGLLLGNFLYDLERLATNKNPLSLPEEPKYCSCGLSQCGGPSEMMYIAPIEASESFSYSGGQWIRLEIRIDPEKLVGRGYFLCMFCGEVVH